MDSSMVEENGNASLDPLNGPSAAPADNGSNTAVLSSGANIVQLLPTAGSTVQVSLTIIFVQIILIMTKNYRIFSKRSQIHT